MKTVLTTTLAASIALALTWTETADAGGKKGKLSDSVVKMTAKKVDAPTGKAAVVLSIAIDKGWHLYANPVGVEDIEDMQVVVSVKGTADAKIEYPKGKEVKDEYLGKIKIYEGKIDIRATFDRKADDSTPIELNVRLNACTDQMCLKQATVKVAVP